ncbi:unnamed protein product [Caenorhabditis auriculariae]|uniref:Uncharacterized protein n=1 Tax=Caenorhabditis auriculariae TaxID=2777116 RepID=A0A8S1HXH8_9PELO|nr:unnamed protein product [Caenorhabditis auriculariae]
MVGDEPVDEAESRRRRFESTDSGVACVKEMVADGDVIVEPDRDLGGRMTVEQGVVARGDLSDSGSARPELEQLARTEAGIGDPDMLPIATIRLKGQGLQRKFG